MNPQNLLTDLSGEVRELTARDMEIFKPAGDVLPPDLCNILRLNGHRPQKTPTKIHTTIRLSPEVISAFKATGPGWQARIDALLCDAVHRGLVKA